MYEVTVTKEMLDQNGRYIVAGRGKHHVAIPCNVVMPRTRALKFERGEIVISVECCEVSITAYNDEYEKLVIEYADDPKEHLHYRERKHTPWLRNFLYGKL